MQLQYRQHLERFFIDSQTLPSASLPAVEESTFVGIKSISTNYLGSFISIWKQVSFAISTYEAVSVWLYGAPVSVL